MKISPRSYDWALVHLTEQGDSDLFPSMLEFQAFKHSWRTLRPILENLDVEKYKWLGTRRFVVPKEQHAFRIATQLQPLDSLILSAIVYEIGEKLENSRVPQTANTVYSYRFGPNKNGQFYADTNAWENFWDESKAKAASCKYVVVTDITDYYNQIYHHEVENQLRSAGLASEIVVALMTILKVVTDSVSRGIPVGPHAVHILAECALNSIDRGLQSNGYSFCRFVDDIHIFCKSKQEAEVALFDFAQILDKHQRLTVQKQKTKVMTAKSFTDHAEKMREDQVIDNNEKTLLTGIRRRASGQPYGKINIEKLSPIEQTLLKQDVIESILTKHMKQKPIRYQRIGWLYRRLSQTGSPVAISFTLTNLKELTPAIGNITRYLLHAIPNFSGNEHVIGEKLSRGLDVTLIKKSDYVQMILLDLFSRRPELDHVESITSRYHAASPPVRREIIKVAGASKNFAWIKERKAEFRDGDRWIRPALISASACLPGDEGKFWIQSIRSDMTFVERIVARWAYGEQIGPNEISVQDLE